MRRTRARLEHSPDPSRHGKEGKYDPLECGGHDPLFVLLVKRGFFEEGERKPLQRFRSEFALQSGNDGMIFRRVRRGLVARSGGSMLRVVHGLNAEADMKEIAKQTCQHLVVPLDAGLLELRPAADPDAAAGDAGQPRPVHERPERDLPLADSREEFLPAGLNLAF